MLTEIAVQLLLWPCSGAEISHSDNRQLDLYIFYNKSNFKDSVNEREVAVIQNMNVYMEFDSNRIEWNRIVDLNHFITICSWACFQREQH